MRLSRPLLVPALLFGQAAFADIIVFTADLSGPQESPPNSSTGMGTATITIDTILNLMEVVVDFSGLSAADTASHIHCCTSIPDTGTAGVATTTPTFTGFPLGVTSGTYDHVFDLTQSSSYNPAFVTAEGGTTAGAEAALLAGLKADEAYLNIHTTNFPGGEIRGFLAATPEPSALPFVGLALIGLALVGRATRSRRKAGG